MNIFKKSFLLLALYTPTACASWSYKHTQTTYIQRPASASTSVYQQCTSAPKYQITGYTIKIENSRGRRILSTHVIEEESARDAIDRCIEICETFDPCTRIKLYPEVTLDNLKTYHLSTIKTSPLSRSLRRYDEQIDFLQQKLETKCLPYNILQELDAPTETFGSILFSVALIGATIYSFFAECNRDYYYIERPVVYYPRTTYLVETPVVYYPTRTFYWF